MSTVERMTIAELEKLADSKEEGQVEIMLNGEIKILSAVELLEKNLELERQRNEYLRNIITGLRLRIGRIRTLCEESQTVTVAHIGKTHS